MWKVCVGMSVWSGAVRRSTPAREGARSSLLNPDIFHLCTHFVCSFTSWSLSCCTCFAYHHGKSKD
jgi:hypothetical protein